VAGHVADADADAPVAGVDDLVEVAADVAFSRLVGGRSG
jgi:hypothetical protein